MKKVEAVNSYIILATTTEKAKEYERTKNIELWTCYEGEYYSKSYALMHARDLNDEAKDNEYDSAVYKAFICKKIRILNDFDDDTDKDLEEYKNG